MTSDFEDFSDSRYAELLHVELAENHRVGRLQILHASLHQIPGALQAVIYIDADDLHRIMAAIVTLPLRPAGDELLRVSDTRHCTHLIQLPFAEGYALLHVRNILGGDPKIGAGVVDQV